MIRGSRSGAPPDTVQFLPVDESDFDAMADLRALAMRPSLERLGRYDAERSRSRLRANFAPAGMRWICQDGERVGFYAVSRETGALRLDHLYLHPDAQGRGLGGIAVAAVIAQAYTAGLPLRVTALRGSESNAFYRGNGFVQTGESEWDIEYEHAPR